MGKSGKGSWTNQNLQKGNKVYWFDGNKKGTGVIVRPVNSDPLFISNQPKNNGKPFYSWFAEQFEVKDDDTGIVKEFHIRDLKKIPSNRDKKKAAK